MDISKFSRSDSMKAEEEITMAAVAGGFIGASIGSITLFIWFFMGGC